MDRRLGTVRLRMVWFVLEALSADGGRSGYGAVPLVVGPLLVNEPSVQW